MSHSTKTGHLKHPHHEHAEHQHRHHHSHLLAQGLTQRQFVFDPIGVMLHQGLMYHAGVMQFIVKTYRVRSEVYQVNGKVLSTIFSCCNRVSISVGHEDCGDEEAQEGFSPLKSTDQSKAS